MDWNRKNLWSVTVASLITVTSLLGAADSTQLRNLENRVSSLEQKKGSGGMINPAARPVVKNGVDLFLQGDVLLWQASETGLEYAIKNDNSTAYISDGRILKPHFEWNWGFKLAAGYDTMHDGWDLFLQWTRFNTRNDENGTSASSVGTLFPTFVNEGVLATFGAGDLSPVKTGFQGVGAFWKLHLNLLDLELGREFYVSKWMTLRPHAGLRSAWVQQRLNVNYLNGAINGLLNTPLPANLATHMKNNFWGMGLRAGLDGNWGIGNGFSLFSDLAAALLLGHFSITQFEFLTTSSPEATRLNVREKYRATRATLDMGMGLRYENNFADDNYAILVQLGWEQHLFFGQNQLKKFFGLNGHEVSVNYAGLFEASQDDLSTQGATLSAKFNF